MLIRTKHYPYLFVSRKKGGDHVIFFFRVAQCRFKFYFVVISAIIIFELGLPTRQNFEFLLT
jgi:hypothetical protein